MRVTTKLALLLFLSAAASAQTTATQRIIEEALKPSAIDRNLQTLTDQIGGRTPGSPAYQKAVDWALAAFKAAGADSVQAEEFTIANAWKPGPLEIEAMSGCTAARRCATSFHPRAVPIAYSPAARGEAQVVDVGMGSAAELARAGDLSGRILLVHSDVLKTWEDLFGEYLKPPAIIDAAVRGRALAILWTATREHDILYRHLNTFLARPDRIPQMLVAREDAERIARLAAGGGPVRVAFNLGGEFAASATTANVVAELRGSELPNEMVILGAHLDSWELGTGALDNGCNAALVIDALRAIKAAGVKPRRTLRFVLFGAEEQGMLGSKAYVARHRAEMDNVAAEIIFDSGTGATTGFSLGGRPELKAAVQPLLQPFEAWGVTSLTDDAFVGTDNLDFLLEGVPNLVANQQEANYMVNYHATSDTFDKVDMPQLKKHVAVAAAVMAGIAQAPQRPGPRQTRTQVEETMRRTQLDQQLKTFGLWQEWESGARGRK